jgi:hypothetical protein
MFRPQLVVVFCVAILAGTSMERVSGEASAEQAEFIPFRPQLTHLASLRSLNCPVACFCSATTWNCDGANLNAVPTGFPDTVMHLNFINNDITQISAGVFKDFPRLRTIDFRNNSITRVVADSFVGLPVLQTIYLSFNKITHIDVGAFRELNQLQILRLDHNMISKLYRNTFKELPNLEEIRFRDNPTLCCVEPQTFNNLPALIHILMYRTQTNSTIFGTYDVGKALSKTTFANGQSLSDDASPVPGCPSLANIELGKVKLRALYPNYFMSNEFLQIIRRIGTGFPIYSTDQHECDIMNKAAVFTDEYGSTVCMVAPAARLVDSPSRREKSHLTT